ncbi:MAG: aldo/keto reductase [Candidatus Brocadiae bacterium]|nr:aldo/keto reductase [Candidatus Brocadiia bacterium]
MEYAKLGSSDVEVSRVMFGAWAVGGWLWGGTDDEGSVAAIRKGIDLGMTTIDTAPVYGFGHSERIVGQAIAGRRDEVIIATKCGLRWDREGGDHFFDSTDLEGRPVSTYRNLRADSILEEIDRSLERLGVDYVDLYQCHWPDPTTPLSETMEGLNKVLEEGKARAVGVSNFTEEMIEEAGRYGPVASDQPLYNMLDRDAERDVLPFCAERDVAVIVYSPLHQGLLTGKVTMERTFPESDQRSDKVWFHPQNRKRVLDFLEKVTPIAEGHGKTLAQVAINWCLCQHGLTAAIVGARRPEQVEENAGGAGWRLSEGELAQIRGWLDDLAGPTK